MEYLSLFVSTYNAYVLFSIYANFCLHARFTNAPMIHIFQVLVILLLQPYQNFILLVLFNGYFNVNQLWLSPIQRTVSAAKYHLFEYYYMKNIAKYYITLNYSFNRQDWCFNCSKHTYQAFSDILMISWKVRLKMQRLNYGKDFLKFLTYSTSP